MVLYEILSSETFLFSLPAWLDQGDGMRLEAVISKAQLVLGILMCLWLILICAVSAIYGGVLLYSNFFAIDADAKHLENRSDPLFSAYQAYLNEQTLMVKTFWFDDLNSRGIYDEGEEILDTLSRKSAVYSLTDESAIHCPVPHSEPPGESGSLQPVTAEELNFRKTPTGGAGDIGGQALAEGNSGTQSRSNRKVPIKRRVYTKTKVRVIGANALPQSLCYI
jgi:hypothetical protein